VKAIKLILDDEGRQRVIEAIEKAKKIGNAYEVQKLTNLLANSTTYQKSSEEDIVEPGDLITIDVKCSSSKFDFEETIRLVTYPINEHTDIMEISIDSPLGKAIFNQRVGSEISYQVDTMHYSVYLLAKLAVETDKNYSLK